MQTTPTLQANIAGTSTTVNLRDWLNTRLSPFLKKAIIESLDSEYVFLSLSFSSPREPQNCRLRGDENADMLDQKNIERNIPCNGLENT